MPQPEATAGSPKSPSTPLSSPEDQHDSDEVAELKRKLEEETARRIQSNEQLFHFRRTWLLMQGRYTLQVG